MTRLFFPFRTSPNVSLQQGKNFSLQLFVIKKIKALQFVAPVRFWRFLRFFAGIGAAEL